MDPLTFNSPIEDINGAYQAIARAATSYTLIVVEDKEKDAQPPPPEKKS